MTRTVSCQVCHSVTYINCNSCHVARSETTGNPFFDVEESFFTFLIGAKLTAQRRPAL